MQILKEIVKIGTIASTDKFRAHINGVALSKKNGQIDLVATDGHRLVVRSIDCPELVEIIGDNTFLFGLNDLKLLKILIKTGQMPLWFRNGDKLGLRIDNIIFYLSAVKYPQYEMLIPNKKPVHKICLNAKLLLELAKTLAHEKHPMVTLEMSEDPLSPMVIRGKEADVLGVLMPCRM